MNPIEFVLIVVLLLLALCLLAGVGLVYARYVQRRRSR